jgi:hypothetical protein
MSDAVKGGLFVGVAVVTGVLVGLLAPTLVGSERETARGTLAQKAQLPTMPSVVGEPLDQARTELRGRGIAYETDAPQIVETVVPDILEVCESDPAPGGSVRGSARLHVALARTCGI